MELSGQLSNPAEPVRRLLETVVGLTEAYDSRAFWSRRSKLLSGGPQQDFVNREMPRSA